MFVVGVVDVVGVVIVVVPVEVVPVVVDVVVVDVVYPGPPVSPVSSIGISVPVPYAVDLSPVSTAIKSEQPHNNNIAPIRMTRPLACPSLARNDGAMQDLSGKNVLSHGDGRSLRSNRSKSSCAISAISGSTLGSDPVCTERA